MHQGEDDAGHEDGGRDGHPHDAEALLQEAAVEKFLDHRSAEDRIGGDQPPPAVAVALDEDVEDLVGHEFRRGLGEQLLQVLADDRPGLDEGEGHQQSDDPDHDALPGGGGGRGIRLGRCPSPDRNREGAEKEAAKGGDPAGDRDPSEW